MCTDQPPETVAPQQDGDSPVEKAPETTVDFVKTHQAIQLQGSYSLFVKETPAFNLPSRGAFPLGGRTC